MNSAPSPSRSALVSWPLSRRWPYGSGRPLLGRHLLFGPRWLWAIPPFPRLGSHPGACAGNWRVVAPLSWPRCWSLAGHQTLPAAGRHDGWPAPLLRLRCSATPTAVRTPRPRPAHRGTGDVVACRMVSWTIASWRLACTPRGLCVASRFPGSGGSPRPKLARPRRLLRPALSRRGRFCNSTTNSAAGNRAVLQGRWRGSTNSTRSTPSLGARRRHWVQREDPPS
jgi:hypothetical protein